MKVVIPFKPGPGGLTDAVVDSPLLIVGVDQDGSPTYHGGGQSASANWRSGLMPDTEAFGQRIGARFVDVSGSDVAYFELFRELWSEGETFVIVEHDCVPDDEVVPALWGCPEPYCSVVPAGVGLWCVKFGAELIRRWPSLFDEMTGGLIQWGGLDLVIVSALAAHGLPERHHHPLGIRHREPGNSAYHDGPYSHPGNGMRGAPIPGGPLTFPA